MKKCIYMYTVHVNISTRIIIQRKPEKSAAFKMKTTRTTVAMLPEKKSIEKFLIVYGLSLHTNMLQYRGTLYLFMGFFI